MEGTRTILTNAIGRCVARLYYLCGGAISVVALEEGKCLHKQIIESGCKSNVFVGTSLVHMYAKCGCWDSAQQDVGNESNLMEVALYILDLRCKRY
jgi:hypothetical protein